MRDLIEDPDGAPYPEPVQYFWEEFGMAVYSEPEELEDFRIELVKALESVAKFNDEA